MGAEHLLDVVDGYNDLGSGNLKDPTKHWFAQIWTNVKKAPVGQDSKVPQVGDERHEAPS